MSSQAGTTNQRRARRMWVTTGSELVPGAYLKLPVIYAGEVGSVILYCHDGAVHAFHNRCVHMPRELDCEKATIFDDTGRQLRCSMHGIVYDIVAGRSLSTMCNGQRLTPIAVARDADGIWIVDKRVRPWPPPTLELSRT